MIDTKAFRTFSSGLSVVSSSDGMHQSGCVINTGLQLTSSPFQIMACANKENYTEQIMEASGHFALATLTQEADMSYIGRFGFHTGKTFDKYGGSDTHCTELGDPYVTECVAGLFSCEIVKKIDVGTHMLFVGEVKDTQVISDAPLLTYEYYHSTLKGKTPSKASSFLPDDK